MTSKVLQIDLHDAGRNGRLSRRARRSDDIGGWRGPRLPAPEPDRPARLREPPIGRAMPGPGVRVPHASKFPPSPFGPSWATVPGPRRSGALVKPRRVHS